MNAEMILIGLKQSRWYNSYKSVHLQETLFIFRNNLPFQCNERTTAKRCYADQEL